MGSAPIMACGLSGRDGAEAEAEAGTGAEVTGDKPSAGLLRVALAPAACSHGFGGEGNGREAATDMDGAGVEGMLW